VNALEEAIARYGCPEIFNTDQGRGQKNVKGSGGRGQGAGGRKMSKNGTATIFLAKKSRQSLFFNRQPPTANRQLPTANCQLPTANC